MATAVEGVNNHSTETTMENTASSEEPVQETDASTNGDHPKEEVALKHLYEQSTQYKFWRYSQSGLDEIRSKANKRAATVIGENIRDEREQVYHS